MKKQPFITMTASIVFMLLFAPLSLSQELTKSGKYYIAEITKSFKVESGGELRIFDVSGDIDITIWDKSEVYITEMTKMDVYTEKEAQTVLERSKSSYRQVDNRVEVGGGYHRRDWVKSEFNIKVPKKFDVDIATRGGDIGVSGLTGLVELSTSGGEIILRDIDGEVDAKTSGGDIEVINSTQRVEIRTSGGDLYLEDIGGPLLAKTSGGDITLTGSEARAELQTSGGDIVLRNIGDEVQAQTSGGDIEIDDARGAVEVHTSGGDIEIDNVGGNLNASTSGGDIEGRSINGGARVSTSGGDIELLDVKGGVDGRTAGGDIVVEITLTDFKKDHRVNLRTAGGRIELTIPPKLPATIRAEVEITDRWEDYNIISDFPLTINEDKEERERWRGRKYIRGDGDINGGGDLIELYTTNGDIEIRKGR